MRKQFFKIMKRKEGGNMFTAIVMTLLIVWAFKNVAQTLGLSDMIKSKYFDEKD